MDKVKEFINNTPRRGSALAKIEGYTIVPNNIIGFNNEKSDIKTKSSAGVYVFTEISTNKQYIGSYMDFSTRLTNHIRLKKGALKRYALENGGRVNFNFGTAYAATNYLKAFRDLHPTYILSQGEAIYLTHLTHIEAKLLEQSLISTIKPE